MNVIKINMEKLNRYWDPRNVALYCLKNCTQIYYFDDNFIWQSCDVTEAVKKGIKNIKARTWDKPTSYYLEHDADLIFGRQNGLLEKKILKTMRVGSNISDFIHLCETVRIYIPTAEEIERRQWWRDEMHRQDLAGQTDVERFVTKIQRPRIDRENGNCNEKTFDFIRINMSVRTYLPRKIEFIKEHKKELIQMAIDAVKTDKDFKKYNVPVNYLRLVRMTLLKDSQIEYLFELKSVNDGKSGSPSVNH